MASVVVETKAGTVADSCEAAVPPGAGLAAQTAPPHSAASKQVQAFDSGIKEEAPKRRLVDTPLAAALIENGCIVGIAALHQRIRLPGSRASFLKIWLSLLVGGLVMIEGSILAQMTLINTVYSHLPFFSEAAARQSRLPWRTQLREWIGCNFVTHSLTSGYVALILRGALRHKRNKISQSPRFRLHSFLAKLAFVRCVSDIIFYLVHRALHTRQLYYIHKRHHEHTATAINTNFHFSVLDLLLEGFTPIFGGAAALSALGVKSSPLEKSLFAVYIQWYEIGSHSGKPMPTVTLFPPLAPIYKFIFGDIDARNVEFHNEHHAHRNCNYGITQWIDRLMGTCRIDGVHAQQNKRTKQLQYA